MITLPTAQTRPSYISVRPAIVASSAPGLRAQAHVLTHQDTPLSVGRPCQRLKQPPTLPPNRIRALRRLLNTLLATLSTR
jgi:hypothetical protein